MSRIGGVAYRRVNQESVETDVTTLHAALSKSDNPVVSAMHVGPTVIGVSSTTHGDDSIAERRVHQWSYCLAYCGSSINRGQLRVGSRPKGTIADALLELYLSEGLQCVARLRADFVLAIWDGEEEALHLVTDRFRLSPLVYYTDADRLIFASRLSQIREWKDLRLTIDPRAIVDVMAGSVIPTPRTIFEEIRKVPPGQVLTYRHGAIGMVPYWDINFLSPDSSSQEVLAKKLKQRFSESIKMSVDSDGSQRSIGTFLSGGVDSSTVTGVLRSLSPAPIKSFSIGFGEERFNEMSFARLSAAHFGVEHHEYFVTAEDAFQAVPLLSRHFDEPFANASAIPTYYCAKLGRDHGVEVMYAGDGGDELFAGNERYSEQRRFEYYDRLPRWIGRFIMKPVVQALAETTKLELFINGRKYIRRAEVGYPKRLSTYGLFDVIPPGELFELGLLDQLHDKNRDPYEAISRYYFQAQAIQELDKQLYVDLKLAVGDNDAIKVTTMAAAAGMEVRFPFLDHSLVDFAATVPADLKMRGRELRTFFKWAYSDLLPEAVQKKTKHGFGLPIPIWLRTDKRLNEMMQDLVLSSRSLQRGYFQGRMLAEMVERHKYDTTSFYGTVLWNVMVLELWHRQHWDC